MSFTVEAGEFVGLIGESGAGKTTVGTAVLRLLQRPGRISGGQVIFDGTDITSMDEDDLRELRWTGIATVFQSSMNSLNPVVRIEGQFRDVIEFHTDKRGDAVRQRIETLFDMVLIDHKFIDAYPHELSGGMKQRVNLALALAVEPRLVLLDEPTTGLDVVVQHSILENVRKLQAELGFAVLFISHDIGTVLNLSDRILVMYAGKIVEEQPAQKLLRDPDASLHQGPARLLRRSSGRDHPDHLRPGPAAGSGTPTGRLPVRTPLPGEDRSLHDRRPAARSGSTVAGWPATWPSSSARTGSRTWRWARSCAPSPDRSSSSRPRTPSARGAGHRSSPSTT